MEHNKTKAVNIFFSVLIVFYLGMSFVVGIIVQLGKYTMPVWPQYVLSQVIAIIPAVIYAAAYKRYFPKEISYKPLKPIDALVSLLTGYALIPMVLFIGNLTMLFAANHIQESADGLLQYPFMIQLLIVAVIPPFVEEFIFRGLFYHSYRKQGILAAAVLSGFIFGLFHFNINQFCYAFIMGIIFAYMVEATGSMWSSVLAHFAVNTYSVGMMALVRYLSSHSAEFKSQYEAAQSTAAGQSLGTVIPQLVTLAGTAVCFMFFAAVMIRGMARRNGRLDNITQKRGNIKNIVSLPVIITAAVCIIYMILIEI
ncbi:MAG: type II CAAX endopeptidase family protein [Eubacteriales bacterium]|nr:type II CAAX endopeptidase family protein [Eubacteriales bacterium]